MMKYSIIFLLVAFVCTFCLEFAFAFNTQKNDHQSDAADRSIPGVSNLPSSDLDFQKRKRQFLINAAKLTNTSTFEKLLQKFGEQFSVTKRSNDNEGTLNCVVCVASIKLVENIADQHSGDVTKAMETLCEWIQKPELQLVCKGFVTFFGPEVAKLLALGFPPDQTCQKISLCNRPQCKLFPSNYVPPRKYKVSPFKTMTGEVKALAEDNNSWWQRIYDVFDKHTPLDDFDGDMSATLFGFRGSAWRGKDCNDLNKDIHPGRSSPAGSDPSVDYNCNGIAGVNPDSKKPWKDELCTVPQRGMIVLGDSASAHFTIPTQWLSKDVKMADFQHFIDILENELDFPHTSMYTGYMDDYTGLLAQNTSSVYLEMKKRNRCVHRDYQNISVNGARSGAMTQIVKTMFRDQKHDHPALVFLALIGNDVCSPHFGTDHFTKVEDFERNILQVLGYLDSVLPHGSTVVTVGLVQGEFLYNTMHNESHPIGTKYSDLYDYLNCLELNPCSAWLTSNATMRHLASDHATKLSSVYEKILSEQSYENFNLIYRPFPLEQRLLDRFLKEGGVLKDLISTIDGFHPSQLGHKVLADYLIEEFSAKYPNIFGEVNPNNAKIDALFRDQHGY